MHEELTELLLTWLKQERSAKTRGSMPLETIANIVSWAIFGAALQWSQKETTMSKEQMTNAILQVITEGTARLVPDALLDEQLACLSQVSVEQLQSNITLIRGF